MKEPLLPLLLTLSLPLTACADGKAVSNQVKIDPAQKIQIVSDKETYLTVKPSGVGSLSYKVEFKPDHTCSLFNYPGSVHPSADDYGQSTASFDAAKGVLKIHTGNRLDAVVTVEVPEKQALSVQLGSAVAKIGAVGGPLEASVDDGILKFDSSALPQGTCVAAAVDDGIASNVRNFDCPRPGATLHANKGIVKVY